MRSGNSALWEDVKERGDQEGSRDCRGADNGLGLGPGVGHTGMFTLW